MKEKYYILYTEGGNKNWRDCKSLNEVKNEAHELITKHSVSTENIEIFKVERQFRVLPLKVEIE